MIKKRILNKEKVLEVALGLSDKVGLGNLNFKSLAQSLNIKTPSLYNHVKSQEDLKNQIIFFLLEKLKKELLDSLIAVEPQHIVKIFLSVYMKLCLKHPTYIYVLSTSTQYKSKNIEVIGGEILGILIKVFGQLFAKTQKETTILHAIRILRAQAHGLCTLMIKGGFEMDLNIEETLEAFTSMFNNQYIKQKEP